MQWTLPTFNSSVVNFCAYIPQIMNFHLLACLLSEDFLPKTPLCQAET